MGSDMAPALCQSGDAGPCQTDGFATRRTGHQPLGGATPLLPVHYPRQPQRDLREHQDQQQTDELDHHDLSPALRSALEVLLLLVALLLHRITLNSKNSSKPPSADPNRKKSSKKGKSSRKPGGQIGHNGTTLEQVDDPDEVAELKVDRRTLPKGTQYQEVGHEVRQVIDIDISRFVTEYRAQILEDNQGNRFVASFPEGVNRLVQYGLNLKANAVYMSQYQLIP